MLKKVWNFIWNNWICRNLLLGAVVLAVLAVCANFMLAALTSHNEEILVPDFTGMTMQRARQEAAGDGLRLEVVDSVYSKGIARGAIVRQEPRPASQVKKGRRIRLTVNASVPKKIPMPNLVGYSLRGAMAELSTRGFEIGKLMYVKDIATNNVLSQLYHNAEIEPGTLLPSESRIDLVLGLDANDNLTNVPYVLGSRYRAAVERVHLNSLNIGRLIFDRNIRTFSDSLNAVVYRQNPEYGPESVSVGRNVTLYLTLDESKVPLPAAAEE